MSRTIPFEKPQTIEKNDPFMGFADHQYFANQGTFSSKPNSAPFAVLRRFSAQFDILRACIDVRKNVLSQLSWSIVPKDGDDADEKDSRVEKITSFFETPFGNRSFKDLLHMGIEDLTVLDAVAWYKHRARNGELLALIPLDAAKIRLVVDDKTGLTPEPPNVAYQQVRDGQVVAEYTTDDLIYEMGHPRTDSPYGRSPVESLIATIESYLSVQDYNLKYFTDGNVPPGMITAEEGWQTDDYQKYQKYLDDNLAGKTHKLHRLLVVPHGSKYTPVDRRDDMFFKELQLFSVKTTCALLGVAPSQIGFTDDVNKATAESQEENLRVRALRPLAMFFQDIFNSIIKNEFGADDLEFKFNLEVNDRIKQAEFYEKLIPLNVFKVNEARKEFGMEPIDEEETSQEEKNTQSSEEETKEEEKDENEEARKEISVWRKRALRDLKFDKDVNRAFMSQYINEEFKAEIYARLGKAQTKKDVVSIFTDIEKNAWVYRSLMNNYAN